MNKIAPFLGVALLLLIPSLSAEAETGQPGTSIKSVRFDGNSLLNDEQIELAIAGQLTWPIPDAGLTVQAIQLRKVLSAILKLYNDTGYDGIAVYVDPSNIESANPLRFTDGEVIIRITEGRVGKVSFLFRQNRKSLFRGRSPAEPAEVSRHLWNDLFAGIQGGPLRRKELDRRIQILERHPGRSVAAVVKPPKQAEAAEDGLSGEVDVEMRVVDPDPRTVYLAVSRTGLDRDAGESFSLGMLHNNLLGRDDRLTMTVGGPLSGQVWDNFNIYTSYDQPLWDLHWRNRTYGTYNQFETTDVLGPDTAFIGEGFLVGNDISWALIQKDYWSVDIFAGVVYQDSKVDSPFGNDTELGLFDTKIGAALGMSRGIWNGSVSMELHYDLTDVFSLSSQTDFDNNRLGASPGFWTIRWNGNQRWRINEWLSFSQTFRAQYANERLPGARQLAFGGDSTVRGYENSEVRGDTGVYVISEPRVKMNVLFPVLDAVPLSIEWVPVALDLGISNIVAPFTGEDSSTTILGLGLGARLYFRKYLSGRVFWGYALRDAGAGRTTERGDTNIYFQVSLRY
ncbi:MAG: ShlB/FhaC/HecB family hemolysin secretion/activation protein [Planctomycetota bacterium]|nr:ShlB/FhaC/HecB family hemolysin secretion/activation protein [Planctomycetota bacterium]MDP7253869.1 ShlB/FhaC/HecB family hemolysin secretion/activation protein [Planctomycetota bacterium]